MTAQAPGTGTRDPGGRGATVTSIQARGAARAEPSHVSRGWCSLTPLATGVRPAGAAPPSAPGPHDGAAPAHEGAASLLSDDEAMRANMARVSRALHGLAGDLAASRRESRRRQIEIEALRRENASLRARLGAPDGGAIA